MGNSETTEKSFYLYPTVFSGNMDISKAKKMLGFTPTSAEEAFKSTLAWYEEAFVKFPSNRDSILTDLFQTAIPKENRFDDDSINCQALVQILVPTGPQVE